MGKKEAKEKKHKPTPELKPLVDVDFKANKKGKKSKLALAPPFADDKWPAVSEKNEEKILAHLRELPEKTKGTNKKAPRSRVTAGINGVSKSVTADKALLVVVSQDVPHTLVSHVPALCRSGQVPLYVLRATRKELGEILGTGTASAFAITKDETDTTSGVDKVVQKILGIKSTMPHVPYEPSQVENALPLGHVKMEDEINYEKVNIKLQEPKRKKGETKPKIKTEPNVENKKKKGGKQKKQDS